VEALAVLPEREEDDVEPQLREDVVSRERDVRLEPWYSQSEFAAMVGATRQSVNRALADLANEGLIEVDGRQITVTDVAGLEALGGY